MTGFVLAVVWEQCVFVYFASARALLVIIFAGSWLLVTLQKMFSLSYLVLPTVVIAAQINLYSFGG